MSSSKQYAPKTTPQPTPEQVATFHAALDLYAKGYWLLPIGLDKLPYFRLLPRVDGKAAWKPLQTQRADANTICQWFQEAPDANNGIVCGNRLLVADIDGPIGREELARLGKIPPTVTAVTGREDGGHHYYLRLRPGTWKRNAKGEDLHQHRHIDLQVDGYYVIAPPSLHPSGRRYRWTEDFGPDDVVVADAPEWLYEYLEQVPTSTAPEPGSTSEGGIPQSRTDTGGLRTPIDLYKSIGPTGPPVLSALGADPWSLARDYQVMQKMARVCDGLEKEVWTQPGLANDKGLRPCSASFFCVLPGRGHQDVKSKSASLFIDAKTGCMKYRCWHGGLEEDESQTRFIWEAFYTLRTKDPKTLKGATLNFWLKLHLTVAGVWALPDVACKSPEALTAIEARVFHIFIQTYAIWQLLVPGTPILFSGPYAGALSGLTGDEASEVTRRLQSRGYIRACGKRMTKFGKICVVYCPVVPRASKQQAPLSEEDQRLIDEMEEQQNQRENDWINESRGGAANE